MIGSIPTETDAEKQRVERLQQMTPEKIAPLVVYLGSDKRRRHLRADLLGAQQRDVPVQPDRGRSARSIAPTAGRRTSSTRSSRARSAPSFTPLDRSGDVFSLGPDLRWRSIYDKLLALKIPDAEHTYTDKDTMLYALGVGLGHDPLDAKQLDFVYEKNLKALPTFAAVLGYPGFWVRDLDTGIDWVQDRQRRAGRRRCTSR